MSVNPEKLSIKSEEVLKVFKNIFPIALAKEIEKAIKNDDKEKLVSLLKEAEPIIKDYQAKILNFQFNEGEQVLWVHDITKGVFHKETVEKWILTNLRAFKFYPVTKENPKRSMLSIGLAIVDTVVMNQHRESSGSRVGTFTGAGGRAFAGAGVSTSSSTSQTYGDLVFLLAGREMLRFPNISDPHGVKRLVDTLKKQQSI